MCDRWQEVIHLPGKEFAHPFAFDAWAQAPRGGMLSILAAIGLIEMISNRYYACVLPVDCSFRSCSEENQHRNALASFLRLRSLARGPLALLDRYTTCQLCEKCGERSCGRGSWRRQERGRW